MAFFNERNPIPQQIVHEIMESGLGAEIKKERVTRGGIVREVEVDVLMNLDVAKSMHKWLGQKIKNAEEFRIQAARGEK